MPKLKIPAGVPLPGHVRDVPGPATDTEPPRDDSTGLGTDCTDLEQMTYTPGEGYFLTVAQAAKRLTMAGTTLRRHIWAGDLKSVRIKGVIHVSERELDGFLARRETIDRPRTKASALRAVRTATAERASAEQRWVNRIVLASDLGASIREIAAVAGVSHGTVHQLVRSRPGAEGG